MVEEGRFYFHIKSGLSGHVLDVFHKSKHPGTKLILYSQKKHHTDNQLWYVDPPTRTIRSKLTDFCIDRGEEHLVVNPYDYARKEQQFVIHGNQMCHYLQPDMVITVKDESKEKGALLDVAPRIPGESNHFEFVVAEGAGTPPTLGATPQPELPEELRHGPGAPRLFYIVSTMNNKVFDVKKACPKPGTEVNMYERHSTPAANQLWWKDEQGLFRSKLNDFTLDTASGEVKLQPKRDEDPHQQWVLEGQIITNRAKPGMCLDIKRAKDKNGADIIPYKYHGGTNEHWFLNFI